MNKPLTLHVLNETIHSCQALDLATSEHLFRVSKSPMAHFQSLVDLIEFYEQESTDPIVIIDSIKKACRQMALADSMTLPNSSKRLRSVSLFDSEDTQESPVIELAKKPKESFQETLAKMDDPALMQKFNSIEQSIRNLKSKFDRKEMQSRVFSMNKGRFVKQLQTINAEWIKRQGTSLPSPFLVQ